MQNCSDVVTAEVKYLIDDQGLAKYIASTGGGDVTEHQGNYEMHSVPIHNAREMGNRAGLDTTGFLLVHAPTGVSDFYQDDQVFDTYEDEVRKLVKKVTGGSGVEIFDHTRRSSSLEVQKARMIRESASIVHNDYTAGSGPNRLRDHFPDDPDRVEALLENRFMIVNVWRSIAGVVKNAHIALCDASSTGKDDLIPVQRVGKDRIGEIQLARYSPEHRWYYYPHMQADEALLFKTYDSEDGVPRFTIHTSFDDPNAPADAPPRESIETRCFVFF